MAQRSKLTDRQADYLDAIYHLVQQRRVTRVKQIAGYLKVSGSTVSSVLPKLVELRLVNHAPNEFISLTLAGTRVAEDRIRRQRGLQQFLVNVLSIESRIAETAARSMEKTVPQVVLTRLILLGLAAEPSDGVECKWCEILKTLKSSPEGEAQIMRDYEET